MKKIYIAGAGGMLGEAFKRVLSSRHNLVMTDKLKTSDWIELLDFRDFDKYKESNFSNDSFSRSNIFFIINQPSPKAITNIRL